MFALDLAVSASKYSSSGLFPSACEIEKKIISGQCVLNFCRYILFRKKWGAKGFGMTLKVKDLDFQIGNFCSGSPESFEPYYGTYMHFSFWFIKFVCFTLTYASKY